MKYEIKQRKSDGCWCIYSAKFNIVIAEFATGIPQVTIDEVAHHLKSKSSGQDNACPEYHRQAKKQGWFICAYCDQKLSGG